MMRRDHSITRRQCPCCGVDIEVTIFNSEITQFRAVSIEERFQLNEGADPFDLVFTGPGGEPHYIEEFLKDADIDIGDLAVVACNGTNRAVIIRNIPITKERGK